MKNILLARNGRLIFRRPADLKSLNLEMQPMVFPFWDVFAYYQKKLSQGLRANPYKVCRISASEVLNIFLIPIFFLVDI